jgi:hypothetical protein
VAMGHSNEDTAATLGIGVRTVQKHLERCYRTLGVSSRSQASRRACANSASAENDSKSGSASVGEDVEPDPVPGGVEVAPGVTIRHPLRQAAE